MNFKFNQNFARFKFITMDINDKTNFLREKRNSSFEQFSTLDEMIKHDESTCSKRKKVSRSNPPTGTRQYQLLHRSLKLIFEFMKRVVNNDCDGKTSSMAWEAYNESPLPKFHPFMVRNAVKIAVY